MLREAAATVFAGRRRRDLPWYSLIAVALYMLYAGFVGLSVGLVGVARFSLFPDTFDFAPHRLMILFSAELSAAVAVLMLRLRNSEQRGARRAALVLFAQFSARILAHLLAVSVIGAERPHAAADLAAALGMLWALKSPLRNAGIGTKRLLQVLVFANLLRFPLLATASLVFKLAILFVNVLAIPVAIAACVVAVATIIRARALFLPRTLMQRLGHAPQPAASGLLGAVIGRGCSIERVSPSAELVAGDVLAITVRCTDEDVASHVVAGALFSHKNAAERALSAAREGTLVTLSGRLTTSGAWEIAVRSNFLPASGSPLAIRVEPGPPSLAHCTIDSGPAGNMSESIAPNVCVLGASREWKLHLRDQFENVIAGEKACALVSAEEASNTVGVGISPRSEHAIVSLVPIEVGFFRVSIKVSGHPLLEFVLCVVDHVLASKLFLRGFVVKAKKLALLSVAQTPQSRTPTSPAAAASSSSTTPPPAVVAAAAQPTTTVYAYLSPHQIYLQEFRLRVLPWKRHATWNLRTGLEITWSPLPAAGASADTATDGGVLTISDERKTAQALAGKKVALKLAAASQHWLAQKNCSGSFERRVSVLKKALADKAPCGVSRLEIRRENLVQDGVRYVLSSSAKDLLLCTRITFAGEHGIDAGGLTKEFFSLLAQKMFDPAQGLFAPASSAVRDLPSSTATNSHSPMPSPSPSPSSHETSCPLLPRSAPDPEAMKRFGCPLERVFEACGVVAAKAIVDGVAHELPHHLPFKLAHALFKTVLGLPVTLADVEHDDPPLFRSKFLSVMQNDPEPLELTFEEEILDTLGRPSRTVSLSLDPEQPKKKKPPSAVAVTEDNKIDYLNSLAAFRLHGAMEPFADAFKRGFLRVLPEDLVSLFSPAELELLCCGVSEVNVADLRENCTVSGFGTRTDVPEWVFDAVKALTPAERAKMLQFVTGSSTVPHGGFSKLTPRFEIRAAPHMSADSLPRSHTCFSIIELPLYTSYDQLLSKLLMAVNEASEGFAFS